ncbi:MAG: indole-3-glycerol phosphate synthase TrpC [Dehalococcoidales bacterium]|nr:indole-3-glycerol phosphate synthase TrpC [Dehalococcoidales bacterium]
MLERILDHKRQEVAARRRQVPLADVRRRAEAAPAPCDFRASLSREQVALIAEIKRASPSRGPLAPDLDPAAQAGLYEQGGAAAISVLTDEHFFAGSLADLTQVRQAVELPALRKDFVVDEYQVYEARAAGADAILLIVAALADEELRSFHATARGLGLRCLVEAHDEAEVARALTSGAEIVGVNNRDLKTFNVDLATSERLAPLVPAGCLLVCESGVHSRADVERLAEAGADAILVGEALVKASGTLATVKEFSTVPRLGRRAAAGR